MYTQIDIKYAAGGNLRGLGAEEAWETIKDYAQCHAYEEPLGDLDMMEDKVKNQSPQSTQHVLLSFEVYTPPVTYLEAVKETLGTPIEEVPWDQTKLEDIGLTNHNISLSNREVSSFDEPEPQPNPLPNSPSLYVSLGKERGPKPLIKPHSLDSFRMNEVDSLTINTPPSPHVATFHPNDTYCYYHPCIDDPKKHYGFKPDLLGHSGSVGVDFLNFEMIEDDWRLESKEVSFLREGLNLPVWPNELKRLYLIRKSLEVLRKFHWMILGEVLRKFHWMILGG
ncbi:hypothetical protein Tco_0241991 [Tanacetum coccineum]